MATSQDKRHLFGGHRARGPERPAEPDIAPDLDRLERRMNEARASYELFFMGVEKGEPVATRNAVRAELRRLRETKPRNTALRFRLQQAKARFVSLENYWNRVNRERENGTYRRDVARADRRQAEILRREREEARRTEGSETKAGATAPAEDGRAVTGVDLMNGRNAADTAQPGADHPPAAGAPSRTASRPRVRRAEDLTEPHLQKLYQTYVGARRRCGESVDLRYEDMAAALRRQVPRLMQQTGAREVEFKVVIRSGHAVLKALPRSEDA